VVERNVWELHRMHLAALAGGSSDGSDGNGDGGQPRLLTARGVVQAARLAEE